MHARTRPLRCSPPYRTLGSDRSSLFSLFCGRMPRMAEKVPLPASLKTAVHQLRLGLKEEIDRRSSGRLSAMARDDARAGVQSASLYTVQRRTTPYNRACCAALALGLAGCYALLATRITRVEHRHTEPLQLKRSITIQHSDISPEIDLLSHGNLTRLTCDSLDSFATPFAHGCNGYGHCHFSNVCFSTADGMIIPNVSSDVRLDNFHHGSWHQVPTGARIMPMHKFRRLRRVYYLTGKSYVTNCWRQPRSSRNPAHFMIGAGKLFAAATDRTVARNINAILWHQCPTHEGWRWASKVWSIVEAAAKDAHFWNPRRVNEIILAPPRRLRSFARLPQGDELVVCTQNVWTERTTTDTYLGQNKPEVISAWHSYAERMLPRKPLYSPDVQPDVLRIPFNSTGALQAAEPRGVDAEGRPQTARSAATPKQPRQVANCSHACTSRLRVALFQRTEGSAKRTLHSAESIQALVAQYTDIPLARITLTSRSTFDDQLRAFRSFDVLITPHGSHLGNMIFAPHAVFLEVVTLRMEDCFHNNGLMLTAGWVISQGHMPCKSEGQQLVPNCPLIRRMGPCWPENDASARPRCPKDRTPFLQTDVCVDTEKLRAALERAIAMRCKDACGSQPVSSVQLSNPCPNATSCSCMP